MHNYASSRKTVVKLIHESPQRSYSYFGITTLEESRARNKQNPFFLLLYLSSLSFFLHQHGTHNQHTNSLSGTLPSLRLSPCASLSNRKEEKCDGERGGVAISSAEHKVPFVFRFRDLPRTSIAVGAAVRAFLHPRPTG